MEKELNNPIENFVKNYFDFKFENSVFGVKKYSGSDWIGFWLENKDGYDCLLGIPSYEDSKIWYSNGQHFLNGSELLNMTQEEFNNALKKYVKTIKPSLKIRNIV